MRLLIKQLDANFEPDGLPQVEHREQLARAFEKGL